MLNEPLLGGSGAQYNYSRGTRGESSVPGAPTGTGAVAVSASEVSLTSQVATRGGGVRTYLLPEQEAEIIEAIENQETEEHSASVLVKVSVF